MIDSVTTATASAASTAMKQSIGMNKDDFLTLFVTQLQNQDPLNPMDGTEFISQLAQLTQVEQAYNTNSNLENILGALNASSALSAVSFVGNEITATGNQVCLKDGEGAELTFSVPKDAEQVSVSIFDESGNLVRSLALEQTDAGEATLAWDGTDTTGSRLPSGLYTITATGQDAAGSSFACTPYIHGTVDGVNFSGSSPVLIVGGVEVSFGDLLKVEGVM